MATYTGTINVGATEISNLEFHRMFVMKMRLVIATEMAAQTTPAANGYFTIADVIKMATWPARCVPLLLMTEVVTPSTAAATADIGFAGGQELEAGFDCDAAAGTCTTDSCMDAAVASGFIDGDTVDFEVLTANMSDGDYRFYIVGFDMDA